MTSQPIDGIPANKLNRALKLCHERQFNGQDWQGVAIDAWNALDSESEEVFNFLTQGPDPGCECGFCKTAAWQD